ncbi:MAG: hypothetical protein IPF62_12080 [Bacteroidetes bacterium]|nr:hypothetical protein [Bacteroidota bacterium]
MLLGLLISSPLVDAVSVAICSFGMFGWKVTYCICSEWYCIVNDCKLYTYKMKIEHLLTDWGVQQPPVQNKQVEVESYIEEKQTFVQ